MGERRRADQVKSGDRIRRKSWAGVVGDIDDHGTQIGDGSVGWLTLKVYEDDALNPGHQLPYWTAVGPLRYTEELEVSRA